MKISLCMIVGNEKSKIQRCLESFAPVFDELSIVRAIGSEQPDETLKLAAGFCELNNKEFKWSEFENSVNPDWPHVEDFAAARNKSFNQSTGEVLFWADADDVLTVEDAARMRGLLSLNDIDVWWIPYDTATGLLVNRDRAIRRGAGSWIRSIHERLEYAEDKVKAIRKRDVTVDEVCFHHQPEVDRTKNFDRNERILKGRINRIWEDLYYFQQDLFNRGRWDECYDIAISALSFKQLAVPERYGIFLNLSQLDNTDEKRLNWALEAVKLCPDRREAYFYATNICMDMGRECDVLAYTRIFSRLPVPEAPIPWNLRHPIYDYQGLHLTAQVIRRHGDDAKATKMETDFFKGRGAKISLLHATRGRPQQCVDIRGDWMRMSTSRGGVEHIFGIDCDDKETIAACVNYRKVIVTPGGTTPGAYNAAAAVSSGHILILISDDTIPFPGWDEAIWQRIGKQAEAGEEVVLAVSDGHRTDKLMCVQVMSRARYVKQGHAFSEEYQSMYADNEFTWRAYRDQVVVEARDIVIEHKHPLYEGKGTDADETYKHTNAPERYAKGRQVFKERNPDCPWY